MHLEFDHAPVSTALKDRLLGWQRQWEDLGPMESPKPVASDAWAQFLDAGRRLVVDLQAELGSEVTVRLGIRQ